MSIRRSGHGRGKYSSSSKVPRAVSSIDFRKMYENELKDAKKKARELGIYWDNLGRRLSRSEAMTTENLNPYLVTDQATGKRKVSPWLLGLLGVMGAVTIGALMMVISGNDLNSIMDQIKYGGSEPSEKYLVETNTDNAPTIVDKLETNTPLTRTEVETVAQQTANIPEADKFAVLRAFTTDAERTRYLLSNGTVLTTKSELQNAGFSDQWISQWVDNGSQPVG